MHDRRVVQSFGGETQTKKVSRWSHEKKLPLPCKCIATL